MTCPRHVLQESTIVRLTSSIDKKTGQRSKKPPMFVKSGAIVTCVIEVSQSARLDMSGTRP